ncbi:MAG: winged helix-turn-helix transcriptional regulator [Candidatus Aenigmarchaeota archaeon]|nr:winged helix-turn-helix transcriptional regulator [Candidatus Aenigmarchaeota archaeon]
MKQVETSNKLKRPIYNIIAFLSIIIGGFVFVFSLYQIYSFMYFEKFRPKEQNFSQFDNSSFLPQNRFNNTERRFDKRLNEFLVMPFSFIFLISGAISIISGITILNILKIKEIEKTKKDIINVLLLPEEKIVIDVIKKNGGSLTQKEISKITGYSRVKVHRIVKSLEIKNIIEKREYGMTNKIWLKDD